MDTSPQLQPNAADALREARDHEVYTALSEFHVKYFRETGEIHQPTGQAIEKLKNQYGGFPPRCPANALDAAVSDFDARQDSEERECEQAVLEGRR